MPTQTARLQLTKPLPVGEAVDVATHVNANLDQLDLHAGFRQVTSGTLPATPFRGLVVEETDTGKIKWYNGTTWKTLWEDSGWLVPTLAASWDANNTLNYRILNGQVHLRGAIRHDSGSKTGPSIDAAVATLPVGARPPSTYRFTAIKWVAGAGATEWTPDAIIGVDNSGNINAHHLLATAYTGIVCDGISFPLG